MGKRAEFPVVALFLPSAPTRLAAAAPAYPIQNRSVKATTFDFVTICDREFPVNFPVLRGFLYGAAHAYGETEGGFALKRSSSPTARVRHPACRPAACSCRIRRNRRCGRACACTPETFWRRGGV